MSDTNEKRQIAERGRVAKALVEDKAFLAAVDEVKVRLFTEFCETKPENTAQRERIHVAVGVVDEIVNLLNIAAANGAVEDRHLQKLSRNSQL